MDAISDDVEQWRKLVLHNPVTVTLTNDESKDNEDVIPKSIQQFWVRISCFNFSLISRGSKQNY